MLEGVSEVEPTVMASSVSTESVSRVYVIRRKLGNAVRVRAVAHSALLLETQRGRFFILEYGVPEEDSEEKNHVRCRECTRVHAKKLYDADGVKWKKQTVGSGLSGDMTVDDITSLMRDVAEQHEYHLTNWNCHMAQENTRRALGLTVDNPYNDGVYRN